MKTSKRNTTIIVCDFCGHKSQKSTYDITRTNHNFCSLKCRTKYYTLSKAFNCKNCGDSFTRKPGQLKKHKNVFCSSSCAATYNNMHKTHGNRRSKLEIWLEQKLTELYPNLEIHFNHKDAIGSELDIYFPSLKLAFELNGIFHYEPIFGGDKLQQIQENDSRKFKSCHDNNISLCIIDVSQQSYFKEATSQKYLNIITKLVNDAVS